jgi:hypothetical protein
MRVTRAAGTASGAPQQPSSDFVFDVSDLQRERLDCCGRKRIAHCVAIAAKLVGGAGDYQVREVPRLSTERDIDSIANLPPFSPCMIFLSSDSGNSL